ncbi:hypothetical protein ACLQ2Q_00180 [Microbacterium sp. DT81.1]|uniref:hypothetical protein n=1 Tax=Microbacterium sp. DT81.1 TaxID=3393413 RepID=UPI003CEDB866
MTVVRVDTDEQELSVTVNGYIGHQSDGSDIGQVGEYLQLISSGGPRPHGEH